MAERGRREEEKQQALSDANKQLTAELPDFENSFTELEAFDPATVPLEEQEEALKRFEGKGWGDWLAKWRLYWLGMRDKYPEDEAAINQQLALLEQHEQRLAQAPQTARQRTLDHLKQRFCQQVKLINDKLAESEKLPMPETTESELQAALDALPLLTDDYGTLAQILEKFTHLSKRWDPESATPQEFAEQREKLLSRWDQDHNRLKDYLARSDEFNKINSSLNGKINDLENAAKQPLKPVLEESKKKKKKGKGKEKEPSSPTEPAPGRSLEQASGLLDACQKLEPELQELRSAVVPLEPMQTPHVEADKTHHRFHELKNTLQVTRSIVFLIPFYTFSCKIAFKQSFRQSPYSVFNSKNNQSAINSRGK